MAYGTKSEEIKCISVKNNFLSTIGSVLLLHIFSKCLLHKMFSVFSQTCYIQTVYSTLHY